MVRLLTFRFLAKSRLFSLLTCFELVVFGPVLLSASAFAKSDLWNGCTGANVDARIVSCSKLITHGKRETKSDRITAYINRASGYRARGDYVRALADLDEALQLDPKSAPALLERASIYHVKGEFDRAIVDYDAALKLNKDSAAAHGGRARAYSGKGDLEKALADLDEAVRLDPESASTRVDRGAIYLAQGDFDRAIVDYDAAIRIDAKNANAFLGRANAYRGKHDLERAKQDLEFVLRLAPQLTVAKDILNEVNGLIAQSAAPPTATAPTAASAPAPTLAPAPAVSPMLLALLALVALLGLFAILLINFRRKPVDKSGLSGANQHVRPRDGYLAEVSRLPPSDACTRAESSVDGLSQTEAEARLTKFGPNLVAREAKATILQELWSRARNPLNALLLSLATVSYFSGDVRAAVVIASMVVLAITTAFIQEHRSNEAAAKLRAMVHTTASVRRTPNDANNPFAEIPIEQLVPGDIVRLSAGDIIPAELRLLEAKDLFINQSTLTGEAMPAEKYAQAADHDCEDPFDLPNICFMGANVVSGFGTGVILRTGAENFFWAACSSDRRAARADRLRPGHQQVHLADDPLHSGDGPNSFPHQWPDET